MSSSQSPGEKSTNGIDLGKKRTSGNQKALSPGVPFLHPSETDPGRAKSIRKSFFFQRNLSNDTEVVLGNLLKEVPRLTNEVMIKICRYYGLFPHSHSKLLNFVSDFSKYDTNSVALLAKVFSQVKDSCKPKIVEPQIHSTSVRTKSMYIPKFSTIEKYGFFDPRYSHCEQETLIMEEPIVIGNETKEFTIQLRSEPIGTHIIVQCFSSDGRNLWPISLYIIVNDVLIKGPGMCTLNQIDMTDFPCAKITFHCDRENNISGLIVRPAKYTSFKSIVTGLSQQYNPADKKPTEHEYAICPLTGKLLKYPGRGVECKHLQCFNLKAYIKRATATKQWACPICNKPCPFNQLMYSHEMENVINRAKRLPEVLQQQENFEEFPDDFSSQLDVWE